MRQTVIHLSAVLLVALTSPGESQDTTRVGRLPLVEPGRELAFTVDRVAHSQELPQLLERHLFPPELIMQNQARLQVTEAQRTLITGEISKLQAAVVQMQWSVADETQKLVEQLRQPSISEERALAQIDRLIAMETAVKRAQLAMLIRIRNALTPRQVETLLSIRSR
jgi:hypothetical protein